MLGVRGIFLCACAAVQIIVGTWGAVATADAAAPPPLRWPLDGEVVAGYTAHDRYGPGHRGLDIASQSGSVVRAAHGGRVSFSGSVAGMRSVTIHHQSGWSTSYSYLATAFVAEGAEVRRGTVVGTAGRIHDGGRSGIHFSLRRGEDYVDPLPFMIGSRPVLLPPPTDTGRGDSATAGAPAGTAPHATQRAADAHTTDNVDGCSVALIDCTGPLGSAFRRGASLVATVLSRAVSLSEEFMRRAAVVADWAARAEQAAARALRMAISDAADELAATLAGLASMPLAASSQAALMFEPVSPEVARRIRRRGRGLADRIESAVHGEARRLLDESLEPAMVAVSLREEAAALARYETERARRARSCFRPSELGSSTNSPVNGEHVYVVVSGFGSSYEPGGPQHRLVEELESHGKEVVRFSYSGFEETERGKVEAAPFRSEDTYKDLRVSAGILLDQLVAVGRAYPDKKIVVVAHSQGGVVARYALAKLYPRRSGDRPEIAAFVTIASPHRGSGGAADLLRATKNGSARSIVAAFGGLHGAAMDATSLRQLAWGSDLMRELGTQAPPGIPTTSIAASTDMVVPAPETLVDGGVNVLIDTGPDGLEAHGEVTDDPRTLMAIEAAVRGGSLCQSPEEVARAAGVAAATTVGVERTRDFLADSIEAAG